MSPRIKWRKIPNRAGTAVKTGRFSQQYIAIYSAALHFIWLGLEWRCDLFCQVWSYLHGLLNIVMTSTKSSSMIISSWYQIKLKARNSLISMCTLWKPSSTHLAAPDCIPHMTSLTLVIWCIRPQAPHSFLLFAFMRTPTRLELPFGRGPFDEKRWTFPWHNFLWEEVMQHSLWLR